MIATTSPWKRRLRIGLALALALSAWPIVVGQTPAQAPKPGTESAPRKEARDRGADPALDQKTNQAREEIELMELQLETYKAQSRLAEARLVEARFWRDRIEKQFHDGFAGDERFIAARDDVLMHESRVAWEKAGAREAELRLKQAQRRLHYGEFPLAPQDSRVTELEQRLASTEKNVDLLQQEVGNLRRTIRLLWKEPDNIDRRISPGPR